MVFMDFYPIDGDDYAKLVDGVEKLRMHDASLALPHPLSGIRKWIADGFFGSASCGYCTGALIERVWFRFDYHCTDRDDMKWYFK
jgi:hypothetical protein